MDRARRDRVVVAVRSRDVARGAASTRGFLKTVTVRAVENSNGYGYILRAVTRSPERRRLFYV